MSVDSQDEGVATQPTGYLSGWKCYLCVWAMRSISHNLMDPIMLIAHGQRYHYVIGEDQTLDYLRKAIYENRDIHYSSQDDLSPVLVSMGLYTPISDLRRSRWLLAGTPRMEWLLQDCKDNAVVARFEAENINFERRILMAKASVQDGDWRDLFPELRNQVGDIGRKPLTWKEVREFELLDKMLEEIGFEQKKDSINLPQLLEPFASSSKQQQIGGRSGVLTVTQSDSDIDQKLHNFKTGKVSRAVEKALAIHEEVRDSVVDIQQKETRVHLVGYGFTDFQEGNSNFSTAGYRGYEMHANMHSFSSSSTREESGEAGELLDIYEVARGF